MLSSCKRVVKQGGSASDADDAWSITAVSYMRCWRRLRNLDGMVSTAEVSIFLLGQVPCHRTTRASSFCKLENEENIVETTAGLLINMSLGCTSRIISHGSCLQR